MNARGDIHHRFYIDEGVHVVDRVSGEVYATAVDVLAASRICTLLNCEEDFKLMQAEAKEGRL